MSEQVLTPSGFNPEQLERQNQALRAVELVSREVGRDIPIVSNPESVDATPGAYILDPDLCRRGRMSEVNFRLQPRMLTGAANSAHAVIAGELHVDYANRSAGSTITEIAAKPYQKRTVDERYERVMREVDISRDMAERGELALEPIAVVISPPHVANGATVLLTKFDKELFTLDNHSWGRGLTADNVELATQAVSALGKFNTLGLHDGDSNAGSGGYGYHHKDSKIKNVAGRVTGETGMIDFETTEKIDLSDPMQAAQAAHGDMGLLLESLAEKGFLKNPPGESSYERAKNMAELVYDICQDGYLSHWESASPEVQSAVWTAVDEVATQIIEQHSLIPLAR